MRTDHAPPHDTTATAEDVRVESDGVLLAGTVLEPSDPRAAALILAGSGPLDRDSNVPKLRGEVSSTIARALAARGVASLRYDKRGAGESGGDFAATGMTENYADARAATTWLAARYPNVPVYAIGHSEGALHAAHLAADGMVTGAVLIACPARRGEEILTWQAARIIPTLPPVAKMILKLLRIDPLKSQRKALDKIRSTTTDTVRIQGRKAKVRWLREFMRFDPVPILERIAVPVLALIGTQDMHVPPEDADAVARLVPGPCVVRQLDGLSHLLRDDPEGRGPRGYKKAVREPVSPAVPSAIAEWLDQQLERPAP